MPDEKQKKINPIIICPDCHGAGLVNSQQCKICQGLGAILVLENFDPKRKNEVYYWGKKLDYLKIVQQRQQKKVRVMINMLFFIFGVIGFLSLIKVFYDLKLMGLEIHNFIKVADEYSLLWWFSLLTDMYLIYRINRESKVKNYITKKPRIITKSIIDRDINFNWQELKKYKKIDISKSFDNTSLKIIEDAWMFAYRVKHQELENVHLFSVMFDDSDVNMVFARLGINYKKLAEKIKSALSRIMQTGKPYLGLEIRQALLAAYLRAYNEYKDKVSSTDLLYAIAHNEGIIKEILYDAAITEREIAHVVAWVDLHRWLIKRWHKFRYLSRLKPKHAMNRTYTAVATPNLDAISRDMTIWARSGAYAPCIGRHNRINDIFRVLEVDKLGAILVGPPGVGKKTIIEGIAQLMVSEDVPKVLQDKRLVEMSVSGLIAGASKAGEMEQRIITVMNEVGKSKNIVLFIEDIHHMVGVSAEGSESMDVAEVLAEQMQANNFFVLATTTPEFYKKHIEGSSLSKTMQKIVINEPDEDEAIRILEAKALAVEGKNKIYFSYQAIEEAVKFAKQYLHDEFLPEKAIKIIEEAALAVRQKRGENSIVKAEDIAQIISNLTNIPVTKIGEDESKKLLNLEEKMHQRIVGQEEAVKLVAMALRRARTGLRGQNRPIASFLFLGPTGVGKTEVAKTLSRVYFGSETKMIRVDMSEYQASDALAKLIGDATTGSAGYLTEAVKKSPFALILLDEFEKAQLDVLNIFLQVLDDGRLTDAAGHTIDFTNTIIIGTSNAGTEFIQQGIKNNKSLDAIRDELINSKLKNYYRPELLNRFDGIVVFKPLELPQVEEIAKIFINELASHLEEKGIELKAMPEAIKELAMAGFDPALGARPLRRVIQDRVGDKLAKLFLEKQVDRRDTIVLKSGLEIEVIKAEKI